MPLFYVLTSNSCGIRKAKDAKTALKNALREVGTNGNPSVREATQMDISWVKGMGGHIPKEE